MSQTSRDRVNSRHVRTHKKNSGDAVRRLGTIIQGIFCAQSEASIRLTVWKWSCESRYPGALPPLRENFRRAISPGPTDCPWVSEDAKSEEKWMFSQASLPPFSLIRDFRKQNTRGNVSKISVNHACYRQIGSKSTNHSPLA